ncbi:MAG: penicillin-binding protein 2 [Gammaproteobacteria bacterium]|nr:penicillin-binding protein 2 [Gammaproteobacteria bacterium]MCF6229753.1 penicillin-binding protein 2 [Gammaproteobacteria bacterium]
MTDQVHQDNYPLRQGFALLLLGSVMVLLLIRGAYLHVVEGDFLQGEGDARYLRNIEIGATRGMILDRNGEPLAISTPVDSVWLNPQKLSQNRAEWRALGQLLKVDVEKALKGRMGRGFVYLRRQIDPDLGRRVMALNISGVHLQREYKRYYPTGEVSAHLVGFTNVDDQGQEGMELVYDEWLRGEYGEKQIIRDLRGRIVEDVKSIRSPVAGENLTLTIDKRLQYLAYRELKRAIQHHDALAGSAVLMDVKTGEVLALVNQPAFNPNNRAELRSNLYRNRAVTDLVEPGSILKPFTVAAALESGAVSSDIMIDTRPGYLRVGSHTVKDFRNYGVLDLTTLIQKSSNVGAAKLAQATEPEALWQVLSDVGFGELPGTGFPGERAGRLPHYIDWNEARRVTLSYGYGLSASPLQIAQSYTALANDGKLVPARFVHHESLPGQARQAAFSADVARQVRTMMERVVEAGGTGQKGAIAGYRVAAKTGTVRKVGATGYMEDRYLALYAGLAPASDPRLVMVVVVDEPQGDEYYGGAVAAPVFSAVMAGALRLLNIAPDNISVENRHQAAQGVH